jgi:hypothetical protein
MESIVIGGQENPDQWKKWRSKGSRRSEEVIEVREVEEAIEVEEVEEVESSGEAAPRLGGGDTSSCWQNRHPRLFVCGSKCRTSVSTRDVRRLKQ